MNSGVEVVNKFYRYPSLYFVSSSSEEYNYSSCVVGNGIDSSTIPTFVVVAVGVVVVVVAVALVAVVVIGCR